MTVAFQTSESEGGGVDMGGLVESYSPSWNFCPSHPYPLLGGVRPQTSYFTFVRLPISRSLNQRKISNYIYAVTMKIN